MVVGSFRAYSTVFIEYDENITVPYSGTGEKYQFTAMQDGVVTITLNGKAPDYSSGISLGQGGDTYLLYAVTGNVGQTAVSDNGVEGGGVQRNVTEATFNVEALTDYYVQIPYWEGTFMVTFEANGESGGDDNSDIAIQFGQNYNVEYAGESAKYTFTAPADGVLTVALTIDPTMGTVNMGGSTIVYKADGSPVAWTSYTGESENNATGGTWNVEANQAYYIQFSYWSGGFTATFEAGGDNPGDGGDDNPGTSTGSIQTDTQYDVTQGNPLTGTFTPSVSGTLTVTYKDGSDAIFSQIWESILASDADYNNWVGVESSPGGAQTYSVAAGTTYYVKAAVAEGLFGPVDGEPLPYAFNVTFTLQAGEGGDDEPSDAPEGWTKMEMGVTYTAPFQLYFDTQTAGVLYATQGTTYDSCVFKVPTDNPDDYDNMEYSGYPGETSAPYDVWYPSDGSLKPNTRYYVFSPGGSGRVSTVIFTEYTGQLAGEEVPDVDDSNVTQLNFDEPYSVSGTAVEGKLTPTEDKIVATFTEGEDAITTYLWEPVLFYDMDHKTAVDFTNSNGGEQIYTVEAGKTYYVNASTAVLPYAYNVTFTDGEAPAAVTGTYPAPGYTFTDTDNEAAFIVNFSAYPVSVEGVTLVYADAQGEQRLPLQANAFGYPDASTQFIVTLPAHLTLDGARDDVNGGPYVISQIQGAQITYILNGVTYNGEPVNVNASGSSDLTVDNGIVTVTFNLGEPVTMVKATLPEKLYQYMLPGAEGSTATFEFSGDIKGMGLGNNVEVSVKNGQYSLGSTGGENDVTVVIPQDNCSLEANILTVNFAGVDMTEIPASEEGRTCTILLTGVGGTNNLLVNFGSGIPGAQTFYLPMVTASIPEGVVTVKSLDPQNNSELPANEDGSATFTIEFSGNGKITSAYAPTKPEYTPCPFKLVSGNEGDEYGTTWEVTFPAEYVMDIAMSDGLTLGCNILAVSESGTPITYGHESEIVVTYQPDQSLAKGVDFNIEVPASVPGKLDYFTVAPLDEYDYIHANDYALDGYNPYQAIIISNEDGFTAHAVADGFSVDKVTFAPAITESGSYTITVPAQAFSIGINDGINGEPGPGYSSMEKEYTFTVTITEALEYMDEATLIAPVLDEDGVVMSDDFNMMVTLTWDYTPIKANVDAITATVLNPYNQSFTVRGVVIPYDPNAEGDASTDIDVAPTANTALNFNISAAAQEAQPPFATIYGDYTIALDEALVVDEDGNYNPAQTIKFTVEPSEQDVVYMDATATLLNPADGMTAYPYNVMVTWDEQEISLFNGAVASLYYNPDLTDNENNGELISDQVVLAITDVPVEGGGEPGIMTLADGETGTALVMYFPEGDDPYQPHVWMPGNYNFVIPAGTVQNAAGEVNSETLVNVMVVPVFPEADVKISPDFEQYGNVTVESLNTIEITFEGASDISVAESVDVIRFGDKEFGVYDIEIEGNTVYLTVDAAPGTYELSIPEEKFVIYTSDNVYMNSYLYCTYEVTGVEESVYSVTFDITAPLGFEMSDLIIVDNTSGNMALADDVKNGKLQVLYTNPDQSYMFAVPTDYVISITAPEDLDDETDYYISAGEVLKDEDGVDVFYAITITVRPGADKATFGVEIQNAGVTPEPGDRYTATFNFIVPEEFDMDEVQVYKNTDPEELISDGIFNEVLKVFYDTTPAGFIFSVPEVYTLSIAAPEDLTEDVDYLITPSYIAGGLYRQAIDLNAGADGAEFTVTIAYADESGVSAIVDAQDGKYVVYNVNGVMVLSTDNVSDLNKLDNGLYIVNGKKVLVRK